MVPYYQRTYQSHPVDNLDLYSAADCFELHVMTVTVMIFAAKTAADSPESSCHLTLMHHRCQVLPPQ